LNKKDDLVEEFEPAKKENIFSKMSKFEKIFWLTIAILAVLYIILQTLAMSNKEYIPTSKPILDTTLIGINLDKADSNITRNMKQELVSVYDEIDTNIDNAFRSIENNVDNYLDFHYSVIGEYTELGALATNRIKETIKKRLIGSDFQSKMQEAFQGIDTKYNDSVIKHIQMINKNATSNVDLELNNDILTRLENDIHSFKSVQVGKLGAILGARFIPKIIQVISTKIAIKASSKIAVKTGAKATTKYATSGTAFLAGATCGPAAWVCAPVFAITAWFGTDAIVVNTDEYYNRAEFKQEILGLINEQKIILKNNTKFEYKKSFEKISKEVQLKYRNTAIKRLKIKEQF